MLSSFAPHGWDSDLKKKGLRHPEPGTLRRNVVRWDSDLKKKGLRQHIRPPSPKFHKWMGF